ncbi:MAG TPA: DUF4097 family beta strand repeat-containing protein [Candidatus Limnocylindria bacterium]|nr:DUF4097 family beta strand repeat-containing protein [Candidatus Limnocylindria bacterium]
MSGEPRDPDWSTFDPHEAEREARRAERDARDAARDQERAARDQAREAERMAREAGREERRSRRIHVSGEGLHLRGVDIEGMPFGDFAKGFMKDFVSDAVGETYDETVNGEFLFDRMPRLRVRNISGETTVTVGEPGKITVVATKHVTAGSQDRAKRLLQNLEIRMEKHGDELHVEPHLYEQERGWIDLFRGKRFRVDFEIAVPVECAVDAQTVSGDLSITGTRGPIEIQSVSGDVALVDAQGPLRLKSVSGDVNVRRYVGHVEGNTVSGDVTFDAARVRSMQLHTVSGDIELTGVLEAAREHRVRTISGDVDLRLVDPDLLVEFRTASGDLESEIPSRVTRQSRKEYSVALGDARGHAIVKTVSGDLTIGGSVVEVPGEASTEEPRGAGGADVQAERERGSAADVERTEPMDTAAREAVRGVLERVARGELNVDDAAAALDAARTDR